MLAGLILVFEDCPEACELISDLVEALQPASANGIKKRIEARRLLRKMDCDFKVKSKIKLSLRQRKVAYDYLEIIT